VIIIAGSLYVDAAQRDDYLSAVSGVAPAARLSAGCLDFVQAADPVEPDRINIFERWDSDESLGAFRNSGGPELETPPILSAEVHKYRIAAVEAP
jgi:quinol monooxygenase YgiN